MSKILKRDYYFGAALSIFLSKNEDSRPSLVECTDNSCQYRMITDTSDDFYLYMKYTSKVELKSDVQVWQFSLTQNDKDRIESCVSTGLKTYIVLVCGSNDYSDGEIAVLTYSEFSQVSHKTKIRIKLQGKRPQKYIVVDKPSNIVIDRDRFDGKLTDIEDCL